MAETDGGTIAFPPADPAERERLLKFVRTAELGYGSWGPLKRLYKQAEANADRDPALFGAMVARLDAVKPGDVVYTAQPVHLPGSVQAISAIAAQDDVAALLVTRRSRATQLVSYRFNADNPLRPAEIGAADIRDCHALVACGPFVASLCGGMSIGTLEVYDPRSSNGPVRKGIVDLKGYALGAAAYPYVFLAVTGQDGRFSGLKAVDLTDPENPQIVSETEIKGIGKIAVSGTVAAVAVPKTGLSFTSLPSPGGVRFFDVSDPRRPRPLGLASLGDVKAVAMEDGLAVALVDRGRQGIALVVIDASDPARPQPRGTIDSLWAAQSVTLRGQAAYVSGRSTPIVVNVSDPDAPAIAGQFDGYGIQNLVVSGDSVYTAGSYGGLSLYSVVNPLKPARVGTPPSMATFGYMKRRTRRFLRRLATKDPDAYVEIACAVLEATGRPASGRRSQSELDFSYRWTLADILYGGSDRYGQARHGRGALVAGPPRLRLRRREEWASAAWDRHRDRVQALLAGETLPWQVHEAAFKILRSSGVPIPESSDTLLGRYVESDSPLLIAYAARRIANRLQSRAFKAEAAAHAYVKSAAPVRREIERSLPPDEGWSKAFAAEVLRLVPQYRAAAGLSRRAASACELVARRFPDRLEPALVVSMAADLLNARRPLLADLVLAAARRAEVPQIASWLDILDAARPESRGAIVDGLAQAVAGRTLPLPMVQGLVSHQSDFIRGAAWILLEASATGGAAVRQIWTALLDAREAAPATRTAMASPAALALLERAGIGPEELTGYLRERPFLVEMLSAETFAAILRAAPPAVALTLIASATEAQWVAWRPLLLARLSDPAAAFEFWPSVASALRGDASGSLAVRLLGDAEVARTLEGAGNTAVLDARDPAFDSPLAQWASAHSDLFTANSPLLLQAATHVLPAVRTWALSRVRSVGLDLPFALRLLECQIPASMAAGRAFFEAVPAGDPRERTHALALCDSPVLPVRRIGQDYVAARWNTLAQDETLLALFESFHPDVQAFVAGWLTGTEQAPARTPEFDREVLRSRQKARAAKERVKARQSAEPTVDTATLLALARGRTPRDAEWALAELAKRVIAGEAIEGVSVE